jgi:hypothetical protein
VAFAGLPLARDLAGRVLAQRWSLLVIAGMFLNATGQWISSSRPWQGVLAIGLAVALVGGWTRIPSGRRRLETRSCEEMES